MLITVGTKEHYVPRTAFDDAAVSILHLLSVAEHQTLKEAGEMAHVMSSGTATEKALSTPVSKGGHGHPYGHGGEGSAGPRGPIPNGGDAGVINIQTGEFAAGWQESYGDFIGDNMVQVLFNETEHADLIEHTPSENQIRRPIVDELENKLEPIRQQNLETALAEIDRL